MPLGSSRPKRRGALFGVLGMGGKNGLRHGVEQTFAKRFLNHGVVHNMARVHNNRAVAAANAGSRDLAAYKGYLALGDSFLGLLAKVIQKTSQSGPPELNDGARDTERHCTQSGWLGKEGPA